MTYIAAHCDLPRLHLRTDAHTLLWAQEQVAAHHYLRKAVDPRCRPFAFGVFIGDTAIGCLIFGRPQSTACYKGCLTYGSRADVAGARAIYDRWEVLALCRVWLDPIVQAGGPWYSPDDVPGFFDRRRVWRSTLASWVVRTSLEHIGHRYLMAHPPCFLGEPYQIKAVLSYCDTRLHRGTIYRASGFSLARRNEDGIETWWTSAVPQLTREQDFEIRRRSLSDPRADRLRTARAAAQGEATAGGAA